MMDSKINLDIHNRPFVGRIGVSQKEITPPEGIYFRNWGAAKQDTAIGVHKPLRMYCLTFQSLESESPLVLLSADLGWWKTIEDEHYVRNSILKSLGLDPAQLMFCLTHTHSGPSLSRDDYEKEGGKLIAPYLDFLKITSVDLIKKCLSTSIKATLTWQYGKCGLAKNRDLLDEKNNRYLVGYNPEGNADDTLLLGRITDAKHNIIATIVNYACHPTTLGWDNLHISPDYIGALRETVEANTMAPCIFLQGASGELAPAEQYVGRKELADRYGRQLGYSCMSILESMLPPENELSVKGFVESGAPLAIWAQKNINASTWISCDMVLVQMELKPLQSIQEIEHEYEQCDDPVLKERLKRKMGVRKSVGQGTNTEAPLWIWRLGNCLLIGHPNEAYSKFQEELRKNFPKTTIAVMNVVNGHIGYLPPQNLYDKNIYAVWQTPFASGSLERLIKVAINEAQQIFKINN